MDLNRSGFVIPLIDMIFREILLIVVLILIWLYGIYFHNIDNQSEKNLIKFPVVISRVFGRYKKDGFLNFKSVVITLVNFLIITRQQAFHFLTWSLSILAIFIVAISVYKDIKS
jgi:hypothetical protein